MPAIRRSSRKQTPAVSETPSTNVSPLFSKANTEVASADSDIELIEETVDLESAAAKAKKSALATNKRKRAPVSDSEDEVVTVAKSVAKRRLLTNSSAKTVAPPAKNKGKGKAPPKVEVIESDDEIVPDSEAELKYEDVPDEESDASGSEFHVSDQSGDEILEGGSEDEEEIPRISTRRNPVVNKKVQIIDVDVEMDSEEEDMVEAIKASLQSARLESKNGSSSKSAGSSKSKARGREKGKDEHTDSEFDAEETDDEPLPKSTGKGKAQAKKKTKTKRETSPAPKDMTAKELRKWKKEQRELKKLEKEAAKTAEYKLRKKLGRALTLHEKSTCQLHTHHPELIDVWGDLEKDIAVIVPRIAEPPARLKATLLPFQRESLYWMKKQESGPWHGGILADEMGMGKTIQMIALLCSDDQKPNMVVAPTVAIMQWKHEIETHADGMKVLVWHGQSRDKDTKELKKYDVVLTTYAVLESCFRKQQSGFKRKGQIVKEPSPMHSIRWNRVILDEAHNIKERSTNTAKATFELNTKYSWCLSGTPLQNRVGELYSLVRFLGGDPFSYYFCKQCDCKSLHWKFSDRRTCDDCGHSPMKHACLWNHEILGPIQKNGMSGPGKVAFKKLKVLLDRMMLRRTKVQRADDLDLPPRTVVVRRDYFSPEEKELYSSLFSDAKRQFTTYVDSGTVLNNYSNIFSLLTRMRQMACHPDLVLKSKTNAHVFAPEDAGEATVCRLCNDVAEDAIQSKCRHIFDRACIKQYVDTIEEGVIPECPVCHLPLTIDLEAQALELEENVKPRQGILGRLDLDKWRSSSKIEALVEELSNLKRKDATTKSIVFSQFVNFLDLVAYRLQKEGFNVCRLEGTMSPQARDATIQYFMNNVHVTVFLVSLKAGGVALNLTEASTVFLMDSWWNPAVEYQAMDRIHRLGQKRPVQAIKLVIEDSIESRIVQLQEKKSAMVDATLSSDDQAMGRLTPADLGFLFRL